MNLSLSVVFSLLCWTRFWPYPWERWPLGRAGLAVHPGRSQAECGGDHEGALAQVWQELLHQVSTYPFGDSDCRGNIRKWVMAVRAKRNEVWKYFTEIGDHKGKCKICQAKLCSQCTTTTMRQHRQHRQHPETQRWVRESRPAATKCVGYFHRRKTQL